MNARLASIALAAAALPFAAARAADTPAAGEAAVIVAAASATSAGAPGCPALSSLQRRMLAKYDQDVSVLLQLVWISRAVYQMDRLQTALWAEDFRKANPGC